MYKQFAYYYDLLMQDANYAFYVEIISKYFNQNDYLLDAGCGSGTLAILLANKGFKVVGVDKSEDMLSIFSQKLKSEEIYIPLFEGDLEDELVLDTFTGVYAFFDVINYLDHQKAFQNIYLSLKNNGTFIFDVYYPNYLDSLIGYHEENVFDDFAYSWDIIKGEDENSIIHTIKLIINNHEYFEKHYQKTYHEQTYLDDLKKAGFDPVRLLNEDETKMYFLCKKPCQDK